jgi:hypothetical protein
VHVYCGLATAGERLTTAVVDDGGRVLVVQQIGDEAAGYAELSAILAERSDCDTMPCVPVASDAAGRSLLQLLAVAGRRLVFVETAMLDQLTTREPKDAPDDARRAVAMARALYAGLLVAGRHEAPAELTALRPVLSAHAALAVGRSSAVIALRDVLRELYPAALRAFPDPGGITPLAVLDALPDPVQVSRGQDENVVARLSTAGYEDAADALAALRQAVREQGGDPSVSEVAGVAVRQAVAAVRSFDTASGALTREVNERLQPQQARPAALPPVGARPGELGGAPLFPMAPGADQATAPAAPALVPPAAAEVPGRGPLVASAVWSPGGVADQPPAELSAGLIPAQPVSAPPEQSPPLPPALTGHGTGQFPHLTRIPPRVKRPVPSPPDPGRPSEATTGSFPSPFGSIPQESPFGSAAQESPFGSTPLEERSPLERPTLPGEPEPPTLDMPTDFQPTLIPGEDSADTSRLPELPPVLRPVRNEPRSPVTPLAALSAERGPGRRRTSDLSMRSRRRPRPGPLPPVELPTSSDHVPPVDDDGDSELLIFAAARSAWFAGDHEENGWDSAADEGWRAAEAAAKPAVGDSTDSGLPRRVPQANLVPGSAQSRAQAQLPIVRDPSRLAAQTSGYFRGWQRGRQGATAGAERTPETFPAGRP